MRGLGCISIKCSECGAPLSVDSSCSKTKCTYCGAEIVIPENEIHTKFNIDSSSSIESKTDIDKILSAIKYNIGIQNYNECNRLITAGILTFGDDYRLYGMKAIESLKKGNIRDLFNTVGWIARCIESKRNNEEDTRGIECMCEQLVSISGYRGIKLLHAGILYNSIDVVKFCIKYGADVSEVYRGINPVGLTNYVQVQNGNLEYHKEKGKETGVKEIRNLLLKYGAEKSNIHKSILTEKDAEGYVTMRSAIVWLVIFLPAGLYKVFRTKYSSDIKLAISVAAIVILSVLYGLISGGIGNISVAGNDEVYTVGSGIHTSVEEVYDLRDVPGDASISGGISAEALNNSVCSMTGKVWTVKINSNYSVVEIYNDKVPLETVKCYFNNSKVSTDALSKLKTGDDIIVTGICRIGNYSIKMRSCNI